jgi:hypothetical protein
MADWRDVLNLNIPIYKSIEGSQLRGFLEGVVKKLSPEYLFDETTEIVVKDDELTHDPERSLALLVYSALSPEVVTLGPNYESRIKPFECRKDRIPSPEDFFKGDSLILPRNKSLDSKFRSFEEWTSVNEVKHVSVWLAAALKGIFGSGLQFSLEVDIPLRGEPRPGRLDVVGLLDNEFICFEAKTTISDAVRDGRFIEQIPKYKREIFKTAKDMKYDNLKPIVLLAIGGNEQDLRADKGVLRTSPLGQRLIEICLRNNIKFITANAVWQILASTLEGRTSGSKFLEGLDLLYGSHELIGLTSAGYIASDGQISPYSL